ncbi:sugar phosphate nucleotidyltransferase [Nitrospira lenta]|uniref:Putative Mannose-1-phosphate guanylyltransferase (GDP) n=1 Tax=Nitrospira lenta TaxID=1436998 RepID=A0A330L602_9BACT|nr:sugar phosphate nucleotidyltransferase [Nitrospira lenta]SPP65255.1 putative Mannose-1-phosphate guanylyltransferase (GDP) [Nitrospira lenta]
MMQTYTKSMQGNTRTASPLWSIVLAGGEGKRLAPVIKQWLGEEKPKQYCTFTGTRSMLQHTVDRADCLAAPEQRVTVVGAHHEAEAVRQLDSRGGKLVLQPANRDTAAGIYLPLTYVRAMDPDATVVIYPSDHFIYPEGVFIDAVRHAALAADLMDDRLMLLGIRPDAKEFEYGHIKLDQRVADYGPHSVWTVDQFLEKPDPRTAGSLGEEVLWNTMIIVAKVDMLWKLGEKTLPSMMRLFETFQPAIGTSRELQVLGRLYERMPVRNFSSDVLERAPSHVAAFEVRDVAWNDWGRAERITESLRGIGKVPVFSAELTGVA